MPLIIDGYNLLNESGVFGRGPSLQRARQALLRFLADHLPDEELGGTTVVFDAKDAPPGLPRTVEMFGIRVRYASEYQEADDLIERLIRNETSPKQLTVVSSDHRLHRAARRRKAKPVDSGVWLDQLFREHRHRGQQPEIGDPKPPAPLPDEDVAAWLAEFGQVDLSELAPPPATMIYRREPPNPPVSPQSASGGPAADTGPSQTNDRGDRENDLPAEQEKPITDFWNPFPPGYGEDLLDE